MKKYKYINSIILFSAALFHSTSNATVEEDIAALDGRITDLENPTQFIDDFPTRVFLKKNCTEGEKPIDNCFTKMNHLRTWLNTAAPSSPDGILVDIGTGEFRTFECHDGWNIALRGSGRSQTIIKGKIGGAPYGMKLHNGCKLTVHDLTVSDSGLSLVGAIHALNSETIWSDVDVIGSSYGWNGNGQTSGKHFWFNSRISVTAAAPFGFFARAYTTSSEDWFFGSQLIAQADSSAITNANSGEVVAIRAKGAEVHMYGGNIRSISDSGIILPSTTISGVHIFGLIGIAALDNSEVHIHGTGIDVISAEDNDITALIGEKNSIIHATSSSYALKTGAQGTITRIDNSDGTLVAKAPYMWEQSDNPPSIISITGADTAVEIDCSASGCQVSGDQPHMLIYSESCGTSGGAPWFDIVTQACR